MEEDDAKLRELHKGTVRDGARDLFTRSPQWEETIRVIMHIMRSEILAVCRGMHSDEILRPMLSFASKELDRTHLPVAPTPAVPTEQPQPANQPPNNDPPEQSAHSSSETARSHPPMNIRDMIQSLFTTYKGSPYGGVEEGQGRESYSGHLSEESPTKKRRCG